MKPRKPKAYSVPCDACRYEIGETCEKCEGTGKVWIAERKAA